jgi:hypothetical protein
MLRAYGACSIVSALDRKLLLLSVLMLKEGLHWIPASFDRRMLPPSFLLELAGASLIQRDAELVI